MFGSQTTQTMMNATGTADNAAYPRKGPITASAGSQAESQNGVMTWAPYVLLFVFGGLLVVISLIQNHGKIRESLEAKNLRINLHNVILIGLSVMFIIPLFKVFLTKLAGWNIPGVSQIAHVLLLVVDAS